MGLPELTSRKRSRTCFLQASIEENPRKRMGEVELARTIIGLPKSEYKHGIDEKDPNLVLQGITQSNGIIVSMKDSLSLKGFFEEHTEEEIAACDLTVLNAIRTQDMDQLRSFHANGRPLKCSNRFGESLLHLACRRSFVEVAKFLIQEANVPVRIRDDYGRTILHDAAWACEPNFELIQLILEQCPDLIYLKDQRGHTPLSYARKSHWAAWNKFLESRSDLLAPTPDGVCVR